ncbi:TatD family hydrolase [Victivallis sp. Marseille-Q1083]|uniref:TatD family hydrolase n=1 Tax=Victivallis sp. Marseille-Q1083 TaxID=2717288 RepID=UPI00158E03DE|nr:TatD family hydrolase [Victivallis sp. Marseille-Q1083]
MIRYFNWHTHQLNLQSEVFALVSRELGEWGATRPFARNCYTLQLHPWFLPERFRLLDDAFQQAAGQAAAVGEIGLDRLRGPELPVQQQYFLAAAAVAEQVRKPVILHNVRTLAEIQAAARQLRPTVPWILHRFAGSAAQFEQLLEQGFYFSLGESALRQPDLLDCLAASAEARCRIGLETDDSAVEIGMLYGSFADALRLEPEQLEQELKRNFQAVFKEADGDGTGEI